MILGGKVLKFLAPPQFYFIPTITPKPQLTLISPKENQNTRANSGEDAPIELLNSCTTLSEAHCKKPHLKVLIEIGIFDHQVAGNYWQRKVDLQKEKKRFKVCIPDKMSHKIPCDSKP